MVMPIIPVPRFPNVPPLPGVPPLARSAAQAVNAAVLLVSGAVNFLNAFLGPQWGIFDEAGVPLLVGDSVVGVDFKRDARLSDYPIEKGGFGSYNKVQVPFDARATFTVGGSDAAREQFLTTCDKLVKALTMVSLVTPEVTYTSANVVHYDYRRTSQGGVSLLRVEVWLMEVRITATRAFTAAETRDPSGAAPVSTGTVQPQPLTTAQQAAVTSAPIATGSGLVIDGAG